MSGSEGAVIHHSKRDIWIMLLIWSGAAFVADRPLSLHHDLAGGQGRRPYRLFVCPVSGAGVLQERELNLRRSVDRHYGSRSLCQWILSRDRAPRRLLS